MNAHLSRAAVGSTLVALGLIGAGRLVAQTDSGPGAGEKGPEAIGSRALAFRFAQRLDANGKVRPDAMARAIAQKRALLEAQGGQTAGGPVWTYLGPDNVGGRVRAVVPHPTVAGTLWLASVGGAFGRPPTPGAVGPR